MKIKVRLQVNDIRNIVADANVAENTVNVQLEGTVNDGVEIGPLRRLWEAERAFNDLTNIRVHVDVVSDTEPVERLPSISEASVAVDFGERVEGGGSDKG